MGAPAYRRVATRAGVAFLILAAVAMAKDGHRPSPGRGATSETDPFDTPLIHMPSPPPVTGPDDAGVSPGDCAARLERAGVEAAAASPPRTDAALPCGIVDPVTLVSVTVAGSPGQRILFASKPLISCAMAERMARFGSDIAAPLALGIFRQPLQAIETGPGYECRPRNRQPGGKMSSHGQGNALDVAAFLLADRRRITAGKPAGEDGQRFIWALRMAGCGAFSTVLGPGSDAYHADHLHFDIEARGRDGMSKFCQ